MSNRIVADFHLLVKCLHRLYSVAVPALAGVTVTSGYPLETDLIQSGKAILLADNVTRPGGTIVLVSACPGGAGPLMYETLSQRPGAKEVIQWIAEGKANTTGGPMASRLRAPVESKRLVVVTEGLSQQQLADMEFGYASSVDAAVADLAAGNGRLDTIVLPVGGSTFPYVDSGFIWVVSPIVLGALEGSGQNDWASAHN